MEVTEKWGKKRKAGTERPEENEKVLEMERGNIRSHSV
jgi:hypothetical protein